MLFNNAVSACVGFVPVVGDVVLAMYKANSRNAALLEEFLRIRGDEFTRIQHGEPVVPAGEAAPAGKGKGKNKEKHGISEKDAEQLKPGAGFVEGEAARPTTSGTVSTSDTNHKKTQSLKSTRRKSFSFFGRSSNNGKSTTPPGRRGSRFVEDMDSTNE